MRCCVCGGTYDVKWCRFCGHNFCGDHRSFWNIIGVWQRGVAAVKEWIGANGGTPYCDHPPTPPDTRSP